MFKKKDATPAAGPDSGARPKPAVPPGSRPASSAAPTGSGGKQAYEARRAEKAGMALEKWMAEKNRRAQAERDAVQRARQKAVPKKPGLLRRLLDRAHRPI